MYEGVDIFKEKVYTITQIAAIAGVSYALARKLIFENNIKIVRIGRQILVPEEEVQKIIKLIELRKQRIIKNSG